MQRQHIRGNGMQNRGNGRQSMHQREGKQAGRSARSLDPEATSCAIPTIPPYQATRGLARVSL